VSLMEVGLEDGLWHFVREYIHAFPGFSRL
jgi:hypothetical protein